MEKGDASPFGSHAHPAYQPVAGAAQEPAGLLQRIHQEAKVVDSLTTLLQKPSHRRILLRGLHQLHPSRAPAQDADLHLPPRHSPDPPEGQSEEVALEGKPTGHLPDPNPHMIKTVDHRRLPSEG